MQMVGGLLRTWTRHKVKKIPVRTVRGVRAIVRLELFVEVRVDSCQPGL